MPAVAGLVADLAEQALAGPRAAGVDLGSVRHARCDTGLATILVGGRGAKTMILAPARGAARAARRAVVLDPTRPKRVTARLLELVDHVTPNADEASQLTGMAVESPADARCAARRLRERGPRHVHVRLRGGGCLSLWPEGEALLRPPRLEALDTTGAGEAFAGTLACAIAAGCPALGGARLAVAAAACAVTGFGAQESYPDRDALDAIAREVEVALYPPSSPRQSDLRYVRFSRRRAGLPDGG